MWDRAELKFRGKMAFKANYWRSVLVALIASVVSGGFSTPSSYSQLFQKETYDPYNSGYNSFHDMFYYTGVAIIVIVIVLIIVALAVALGVFIFSPLHVGCNKFFLINREDPNVSISPVGSSFGPYYKNIVKTMFFMNLYIFLWALLFVIPGIIKSYEYRLVPYLLAENPDMDYKEALELSKEIMYGQKMNVFVLDLSFIGWALLAAITLNILGILYVMPYIYATNAELYVTLVHGDNSYGDYDYHEPAPEDVSTVEFTVE